MSLLQSRILKKGVNNIAKSIENRSYSIIPEVCGAANTLKEFLLYIQKNSSHLKKRLSILKIPSSNSLPEIELKKIGINYNDLEVDLNEVGPRIIFDYSNHLRNNKAPLSFSPLYPFTSPKKEKTFKYNFIDLFCGGGGLSLGFEQAGLNPVLALDSDKWSTITYKYNRPWLDSKKVVQSDITSFKPQEFFLEGVDVLAAGIPCQPFSLANQQQKINDPRHYLYLNFLKCAEVYKPKVILIENVNGFTKVNRNIISSLTKNGYTAKSLCIDVSALGMAQNRKRLIYIACRNYGSLNGKRILNKISKDILSALNCSPASLFEAIGDLPPLEASKNANNPRFESEETGFGATLLQKTVKERSLYVNKLNGNKPSYFCYNHKARYNNERDIQIYSILKPGEDSTSESIADIMPYKSRLNIFKDKYYKLLPDKPCKTITSHMRFDCNSYIHPFQSRGLTAREAARVQGFPDNYIFCGTFQRTYQQVGNAVPPPLARIIGLSILANI